MTCQLILTRHAKSSWGSFDLADHDRPLNGRGRAAATAIGNWLREHGHLPDEILSSDAIRTKETCTLLGFKTTPTFTPRLYHADAHRMLDVLEEATESTVLIVGHNPGIGEFAEKLLRQHPRHPNFLSYPTGATTVINFDVDTWPEVRFSSGTLEAFVIPRDLVAS